MFNLPNIAAGLSHNASHLMSSHVEAYIFHLYITNQDYCGHWFMDRMGEFNLLMEDLFQAYCNRSYEVPNDGLPF